MISESMINKGMRFTIIDCFMVALKIQLLAKVWDSRVYVNLCIIALFIPLVMETQIKTLNMFATLINNKR